MSRAIEQVAIRRSPGMKWHSWGHGYETASGYGVEAPCGAWIFCYSRAGVPVSKIPTEDRCKRCFKEATR